VHFPEKVMEEDIAYLIISVGLREGKFFTTQKLSQFIDLAHPATPAQRLTQYKKARALVNGTDHDDDIAALAVKFEKIVSLSRTEAPHWSSFVAPSPAIGVNPLGLGTSSSASGGVGSPKLGSTLPIGPF
jgi:hypothetical protein